ncbi:hypothetical protein FBU59_001740 [Linderina macrospora]|uniref:Uncharacterized protein n=1 Tax=Linderina macrospora TaxID=4868 RepID=A0ACC1JCZ0_9FUNG|nr:hypothetical protein FBU59_001740 [Linderina macrospora]
MPNKSNKKPALAWSDSSIDAFDCGHVPDYFEALDYVTAPYNLPDKQMILLAMRKMPMLKPHLYAAITSIKTSNGGAQPKWTEVKSILLEVFNSDCSEKKIITDAAMIVLSKKIPLGDEVHILSFVYPLLKAITWWPDSKKLRLVTECLNDILIFRLVISGVPPTPFDSMILGTIEYCRKNQTALRAMRSDSGVTASVLNDEDYFGTGAGVPDEDGEHETKEWLASVADRKGRWSGDTPSEARERILKSFMDKAQMARADSDSKSDEDESFIRKDAHATKSNAKKTPVESSCFYCGKPGHKKDVCSTLKADCKSGYAKMTQHGVELHDGSTLPIYPTTKKPQREVVLRIAGAHKTDAPGV